MITDGSVKAVLPKIISASVEAGDAIMDVYSSEFAVELKCDNSPLTLADKRSHEIIVSRLHGLDELRVPVLSEEGRDIPYEERKKWDYFWLVDPLDGTKEFIKKNGEFTVNIALIKNKKPVLGVIYLPVKKILYFGSEGTGAYILESYDASEHNSFEKILSSSMRLPSINPKHRRESRNFTVIRSRSHMSPETERYIDAFKKRHGIIDFLSSGSSLKFCIIAEGRADLYPRFGPTMEWDTAAGQAILENAGGRVLRSDSDEPLSYNKKSLLNPDFVADRP